MPNAYEMFDTQIKAREFVSPSMLRVTLTGPDLRKIGTAGLDQRFKLVPCDGDIADQLRDADHWYSHWLTLPEDERPIARTYTFSGIRPTEQEIDFDVALAGGHAHGPGAEFCLNAPLGSRTLLCGPVDGVEGNRTSGLTWQPDIAILRSVLLVADETALPAARAILASLPEHIEGLAVIEVPEAGDTADLTRPKGVELRWCVRAKNESALDNLPFPVTADAPMELSDEPYWYEASNGEWCGWVAGEAHWVALVRQAAQHAGVNRKNASFMGYWRNDKAQ